MTTPETTPARRRLTDVASRNRARWILNRHWEILELIAKHDPLYICWWDKNRRHKKNVPENLLSLGLITGSELAAWLRTHPEWTNIGEWEDDRCAVPIWITESGRQALLNKEQYDLEPVQGGMVEPGWECIPAAPAPEAQPKPDQPE